MIAHFVSISCASCGGKLEVYDGVDRFACSYCGTELAVRRRGGTVTLQPAAAPAIAGGRLTDSRIELDLIRLKEEAQSLSKRRQTVLTQRMAWQNRGYAVGVALLLIGFFAVRSGGFVIGISALMGGILTTSFIRKIGKTMLTDVRALDLKIDVVNGRIEDRENLLGSHN